MKSSYLLFGMLAASALTPMSPIHGQQVTEWAVSKDPLLTIGTANGKPELEFAGISSVRRLSGGKIIVANGKPRELRVFDPRGKFLARIGRSGGGPGEFQGTLSLLPSGGDTILVFDQGKMKRMAFASTGKLLKEFPAATGGTLLTETAFVHRALIRANGRGVSSCIKATLSKLPAAFEPTLYDIVQDDFGRAWVRAFGASQWKVYSANGESLGGVTFPGGFEPMHLGQGVVAGVVTDDDGVERVVSLRVSDRPIAGPSPSCMRSDETFPPPSTPRVAQVKMVMRQALVAAESARQRYGHYVRSADSLGVQVPNGVAFKVLRATENGWVLGLFDAKESVACAVGIGDATPSGWIDGMMRCGS